MTSVIFVPRMVSSFYLLISCDWPFKDVSFFESLVFAMEGRLFDPKQLLSYHLV
jgi:hypothetical protein